MWDILIGRIIMTNALTGGALPKGQMKILATVRKKLSWRKEMGVVFEAKDAFDWADLVKEILEFVEKFMVSTYLNTT